ncbi:MAG: hypothetical protein H6733_14290 [Alphaproteobacteria bacterium]|nr:hypothetical protein [Alphaproteobacteria bacterium]
MRVPLLLLPLAAACTAGPVDADVLDADITWRDDVLVVADPLDVPPTTVVPDADAGTTWTFDAVPTALGGVAPGDILVGPDLGIVRVLDAHDDGATWVLVTEEAALTDAAEDATLTWDKGVYAQVSEAETHAVLAKTVTGSGTEWTGTIADFEVQWTLQPQGHDFKSQLSAKYTNAPVSLKFANTALVKGLRSDGNVVVVNGAFEDVTLSFEHLELDATLELGGTDAVTGDVTFEIPVRVDFPFLLGEIPMFVGFQAGLEISVKMAPDTVKTAKARLSLAGSVHVARTPSGSFETAGTLDRFELTLDKASDVSLTGGGIGTLLKLPILSLGVGVPNRVEAALFTELDTEIVSNYTLIEEGGFLVGNCQTVDLGLQGKVGGRVKAFALQVQQATVVFAKTTQKVAEKRPGDCAI